LTNCLKTKNLNVGYKLKSTVYTVVADVNLELTKGKVCCLVGANGSGKSTIIKTLLKQIPALSGKIIINNTDTSQLTNRELSTLISFVSSRIADTNNLKVKELIALGRIPYTSWFSILNKKDKQKVEEVIDILRIKYLEHRDYQSLSDGEKQKVMIARALAQDTDIIILDEPTSHLDTPGKYELSAIIKQIAQNGNKAILYSSHDLNPAFANSDKIAFINEQKLYTGTPTEIISSGIFKEMFKFSALSDNEKNKIINSIKQSLTRIIPRQTQTKL
jgi:iron complex transport system ATP-binding protein